MNYFLKITSKPNLPLKFSLKNTINGSYLAIGKFINEKIDTPLIYEDSENSDLSKDDIIKYDVLETVGGGFLISEKLKELIESYFSNEVQIFSTIITYKNTSLEKYFAINIFNKLKCYDLERSEFTIHPVDHSYKFTKIILDTSPLEEYGLVYNIIRSIYDNKIIVSDEFKNVMTSNNINSIKFIR
ncbi:imm11 family protein [Apibacter adventoris]|uniref:Immunity MXAN-0049 protein domain-containing protein n=1 Tax=Apibacter adventoris TaxID=1679466 RepID=A0A2S8AFW3_9FLAO|nr:DUF1629 domain-containing protein [Apibacter adventoris]PQL93817.1 hypothetical protein C4S76_06940 [Apibacter adventoris]PQL95247.1 hypothetical protein C4S77_00115 [Apibacter adventoris]